MMEDGNKGGVVGDVAARNQNDHNSKKYSWSRWTSQQQSIPLTVVSFWTIWELLGRSITISMLMLMITWCISSLPTKQ